MSYLRSAHRFACGCAGLRLSLSLHIAFVGRCAPVVLLSSFLSRFIFHALSYMNRAHANALPQASVFMRTWALARWDEGTKPDLVKDLAELKAEIRLKLTHDSAREGEGGGGMLTLSTGANKANDVQRIGALPTDIVMGGRREEGIAYSHGRERLYQLNIIYFCCDSTVHSRLDLHVQAR